jgi:hypothetical protein
VLAGFACALLLLLLQAAPAARAGTLRKPIDPRQQTALAFGERSHWLQPWRGYLRTVPATRLRDAIGINLNVSPGEADATARLLTRSGFRRARVELGWDVMDFSDPSRIAKRDRVDAYLGALRRHGIRPLILLNAHDGMPGPTRFLHVRLAAPARAGDRRVLLDRASARAVWPGRTGLARSRAADVLFTSVSSEGWATLSRPLPWNLRAGDQPAATLRFAPFGPPSLRNRRVNPAFRETMRGWLAYVGAVTREARAVLGSERFDVEVWNELSFGSDFLNADRYYDPPRERGDGDVTKAILRRTVAYLRDRANRVSRIGIGNGFASQTPFAAGSTSPRGLTAIDKHPYTAIRRFPRDSIVDGISPLDALGRTAFTGGGLRRRDRFVPRYDAFFPEYYLSAIQTESMIRDLSPITTDVYRTPHGRRTHPRGGRAPRVWITEAGLDPNGLTDAELSHLQAKAALRYYTAFVNKGVSAVHLYGAKGGNLALVAPGFFDALAHSGGAYPGDAAGGETMRAVGRLAGSLARATKLRAVQPLSLLRVSDRHNHKQFGGDGTRAHPPLYDRNVLAFLPFQLRRGQYVAAVYVMTRNLERLYRPHGPGWDRGRFDMPPESFSLRIGGLGARRARVSAFDPLTGMSVRARIVGRASRSVTVKLPVTDSPRLLYLSGARRRAHAN